MKEDMQGFVVSVEAPKLPEATGAGVLLAGEFARLEPEDLQDMIWLGGEYAGPLGWAKPREGATTPRPGGLDAQWFDRVWFLPSDHLNRVLCQGMQIHIVAKMTNDFTGDPYCALLTKGDFHTGFRILVGHDRCLLFQLAGLDPMTGGPLSIRTSADVVPLDQWIEIELVYVPPEGDNAGRAEIKVDGRRLAGRALEKPMPISAAVIGIGCEFGTPQKGPYGKRRPNFSGLIRAVRHLGILGPNCNCKWSASRWARRGFASGQVERRAQDSARLGWQSALCAKWMVRYKDFRQAVETTAGAQLRPRPQNSASYKRIASNRRVQ